MAKYSDLSFLTILDAPPVQEDNLLYIVIHKLTIFTVLKVLFHTPLLEYRYDTLYTFTLKYCCTGMGSNEPSVWTSHVAKLLLGLCLLLLAEKKLWMSVSE